MTKTAFVILGAMMTLAAHAAPASAQDRPVQAVGYADLDLSSAAGRLRLAQRIDTAARRVCGRAWPVDLARVEEVRRCRTETVAQASAWRGEVYVTEVALR